MPQVVGALLAGLLLGPALLNIITESDFISKLSEIGVIILMFSAGMEADIKELKKAGKASDANATIILQNFFIGVILTATSVSITVETLKEMGKLKSAAGTAILGAAIIYEIEDRCGFS